ncbi:MAG: phosphatase PAP2 family protein [bacterium]
MIRSGIIGKTHFITTAGRLCLLRPVVLTLVLLLLPAAPIDATDFLSSSEVAYISLGSASVLGLGQWAKKFDSSRTSLITGPLPVEMRVQKLLGGDYPKDQRNNFLNHTLGSMYTPSIGAVALLAIDATRGEEDSHRRAAQNMFLYFSGLAATKGVTGIFKGLFARPRPYVCFETDPARQLSGKGYARDHQSFFSGHTSSAFFAMAFLNKRIRGVMRQEMSTQEYRTWRWAPSAFLLGWASFVGLSRIQAHQHFLSDVVAGALAGYLIAELYYSFADEISRRGIDSSQQGTLLRITFAF